MSKFLGAGGQRHIIECLKRQKLIQGNVKLASGLAKIANIKEYKLNDFLIEQDSSESDVFFLLTGRVAVLVNGREMAIRSAGNSVGEMAVIDPSAKRSASIKAIEPTTAAVITEEEFSKFSNSFSSIWKNLAIEISERLRERSRHVKPVNPRPVLFIGSSTESLPVAKKISSLMTSLDIKINLWSDPGIFKASSYTLVDLENQVRNADFAVMVFGPDDRIFSRGKLFATARDNVILELGMFIGALSHQRVFIVLPSSSNIKIPSDLSGLTMLRFDSSKTKITKNLNENVSEISARINNLGMI